MPGTGANNHEGLPSHFLQNPHHRLIIFRLMRKDAVGTVLDLFSVFFEETGISRTVFPGIQRAVAEQAVKIRKPFVARKISAFFILKKAVRIFHILSLHFLLFIT